MADKQVDIIITIHNRLEHTKQTIESLLKNTDPLLYNLYLIDDKSDDGTEKYISGWELVRKFADKNMAPIIYVNKDNIGPAASRNKVCKFINDSGHRSHLLYHSDNDVYFTTHWLDKLLEAFAAVQKNKVFLIGGGCHPYLQNNKVIEYRYVKAPGLSTQVGVKDAVSGYSQLMTWETWDNYGPFDEGQGSQEKKIMGSEDWAFCQRIIKDGGLVASIEPEVVIHTGKTNTYGEPATGSETFRTISGVKIK